MTEIALIASLVAVVVSIIALGAMIEMFAGLSEVQEYLGIGRPTERQMMLLEEPTKTIVGRHPSEAGLSILSGKPAWYVLFVSTHCSSCRSIIEHFAASMPLSTSIVVLDLDPDAGERWLRSLGLDVPGILLAPDERLEHIGLVVTPSIMVVIEDEMAFIAGVESIDAVMKIIVDKYLPPQALAFRAESRQR